MEAAFAVDKFSKGKKKSHLLLQLQKTYRDDERFKLNRDFADIDTTKLPQSVMHSLTTKEYDDLLKNKPVKQNEEAVTVTEVIDELNDVNNHRWETNINMEAEK